VAEPKIVGKSSGWTGPVEEYDLNEGSAGRRKITFIGASYKFVHRVFRDMLLVGGFGDVEICLLDLRPEPLKLVGDLLERMARQAGTNVRITRTMDRRDALTGCDAAVLSITTGGLEADFRGYEVCMKYGIPVGVGDTLGPPALARCLRMVPVVVEIARDMERLCPRAVMLNFTNPMSVITGAMARYSAIPTWGLCHSADELFRYFSTVFGCKKSEVQMEVGGVNHQAFVIRLWIRGHDRTEDILRATGQSDATVQDALMGKVDEDVHLQRDLCRALGVWPSTGHTHLAEFYKYFFTDRRLDALGLRKDLKAVRPGRQALTWPEPAQILVDWAYGPELVGDMHLLTGEHAHELLWAAFTGQPFTRVINTVNSGPFIRNLPATACVEALVTVAGTKVTGKSVELPLAAQSLVQQWTTIHELSLQAAMNCDRQAARHALFLDPHVRDLYDIEPMLEDILTATKQWLPAKWFA
jgi:alpha-galactosidase